MTSCTNSKNSINNNLEELIVISSSNSYAKSDAQYISHISK